jgi:acyl CoA:acetate/3-ketoacid CoA transferase beta subunit
MEPHCEVTVKGVTVTFYTETGVIRINGGDHELAATRTHPNRVVIEVAPLPDLG